MWDCANQYVAVGVDGGLFALIAFLMIIAYLFRRIGIARRRWQHNRTQEWFIWLLGSALFANVAVFFGVSYFDQTRLVWYLTLAIIIAITADHSGNLSTSTKTENAEDIAV